jgi:transcriptional regulator with PAS, ATPase and Fis domain
VRTNILILTPEEELPLCSSLAAALRTQATFSVTVARRISPVGSGKPKQANVWILASTNIELPLKIQDGTFREDLYYRLAVIGLALPPLRQRPGDISLLASHFWKIYSPRAGRKGELPPDVVAALSRHNWPGNVRELQNVIQQLAVSEAEPLQPQDLMIPHAEELADSNPASFAQRKALVIADFEKRYLTELLRTHQGNVTHAALEAGKDRRALGRLIKKTPHRKARKLLTAPRWPTAGSKPTHRKVVFESTTDLVGEITETQLT